LPPDQRVRWRRDSALNDRGNNGEDLTGGYFDGKSIHCLSTQNHIFKKQLNNTSNNLNSARFFWIVANRKCWKNKDSRKGPITANYENYLVAGGGQKTFKIFKDNQ